MCKKVLFQKKIKNHNICIFFLSVFILLKLGMTFFKMSYRVLISVYFRRYDNYRLSYEFCVTSVWQTLLCHINVSVVYHTRVKNSAWQCKTLSYRGNSPTTRLLLSSVWQYKLLSYRKFKTPHDKTLLCHTAV